MRTMGFAVVAAAAVVTAACTVTSTEVPANGKQDESGSSSGGTGVGSSSGSSGSATPPSSSSGSVPPGSSSGSSGNPPASSVDAKVEMNAACPAFVACGGTPSGTYDYAGGCIGDVFAAARQQCPGLQTTDLDATVKGSIYFTGNALAREITSRVAGKLVFPSDCVLGQCAALQSELAKEFDTATCVGQSGGCQCDVARAEHTSNVTTFTQDGYVVRTADGDQYEICDQVGTLSYKGVSTGAEDGSFSLKKR